MKRFAKFLVSACGVAAIAGGIYCIVKKVMNTDESDFDSFDEDYDDLDDFDEEAEDSDSTNRGYVKINLGEEEDEASEQESPEEKKEEEEVSQTDSNPDVSEDTTKAEE